MWWPSSWSGPFTSEIAELFLCVQRVWEMASTSTRDRLYPHTSPVEGANGDPDFTLLTKPYVLVQNTSQKVTLF